MGNPSGETSLWFKSHDDLRCWRLPDRRQMDVANAQAHASVRQEASSTQLPAAIAALRSWNLDCWYNRVFRLVGKSRSLRPGGPPAPLTRRGKTAPEMSRPFQVAIGRPTIICLPIIDWYHRFQRPQQLLLRLAARGFRILYLDPCIDAIPYFDEGGLAERWTETISANVMRIKIPARFPGEYLPR